MSSSAGTRPARFQTLKPAHALDKSGADTAGARILCLVCSMLQPGLFSLVRRKFELPGDYSMSSWTPALTTGDVQIDKQHQEIFRQVDVLCAALLRGDRLESGNLVEFLGTYVGDHFSAEERAMKNSGYRDLAPHKTEHVRFVRAYLALVKEFELHGPSAGVAAGLNGWLAAWLNEHILRADIELARHLLRIAFVMDDAR
jgi:hemerythrin